MLPSLSVTAVSCISIFERWRVKSEFDITSTIVTAVILGNKRISVRKADRIPFCIAYKPVIRVVDRCVRGWTLLFSCKDMVLCGVVVREFKGCLGGVNSRPGQARLPGDRLSPRGALAWHKCMSALMLPRWLAAMEFWNYSVYLCYELATFLGCLCCDVGTWRVMMLLVMLQVPRCLLSGLFLSWSRCRLNKYKKTNACHFT